MLLEYIRPLLEESGVPQEQRTLAAADVHTIEDASARRMFTLTFVVRRPD